MTRKKQAEPVKIKKIIIGKKIFIRQIDNRQSNNYQGVFLAVPYIFGLGHFNSRFK
ncbi:MAG: hypothetical protein ACXACO_21370 [Promethearchaeota archaeon]